MNLNLTEKTISERHASQSACDCYFQYPSNDLEFQILKCWQKILKKQIIGKRDNFFKIGGDSLRAVELCIELESSLNQPIPLTLLYEAKTIAKQSKLLAPKACYINHLPLTLLSEGKDPKKPKCFLVHPASGLSFAYFPLAKNMDHVVFLGINNPYLGSSDHCFQSIEEMAKQYVEFIKKIQKTGPYFIGGWSFGGNVAFEMAKLLISQDDHVASVILFDSFNYSNYETPKRDLKSIIGNSNKLLNDQEIKVLASEFENNQKIGSLYYPSEIHCQVLLIKSEITEEHLAAMQAEPGNGWDSFIKGPFIIEKIASNHSTMFAPSNLELLKNILTKRVFQDYDNFNISIMAI